MIIGRKKRNERWDRVKSGMKEKRIKGGQDRSELVIKKSFMMRKRKNGRKVTVIARKNEKQENN